jgi:hypothetical protein
MYSDENNYMLKTKVLRERTFPKTKIKVINKRLQQTLLKQRLRCVGHIARLTERRILRTRSEAERKWIKGKPRRKWMEAVRKDLEKCQF